LFQATGIDISESRIWHYLDKWGITRQKMAVTATQRNDLLRAQYLLDISIFIGHPEFFVFLDEMGSDKRDQRRKFAYSMKGSTPTVQRFLYRGQHVSAMAAMTCEKVVDISTCARGVTADVFDRFLANAVLPYLQPFDGVNPCSIIVLDNAMIHHTGDIIQDLEEAGVLVYYLPPYSPDLNPIEEAFTY